MSEINGYLHIALSALYCLQDKGFNKELADAMQAVLNLNKHIEVGEHK